MQQVGCQVFDELCLGSTGVLWRLCSRICSLAKAGLCRKGLCHTTVLLKGKASSSSAAPKGREGGCYVFASCKNQVLRSCIWDPKHVWAERLNLGILCMLWLQPQTSERFPVCQVCSLCCSPSVLYCSLGLKTAQKRLGRVRGQPWGCLSCTPEGGVLVSASAVLKKQMPPRGKEDFQSVLWGAIIQEVSSSQHSTK